MSKKLSPIEENLAIHYAYKLGLKRLRSSIKPKIKHIEKRIRETKVYLEESNELLEEGKITVEDWRKFRKERIGTINQLMSKRDFILKPYKPKLRDLNRLQRFFYDRAITCLTEKTEIAPIDEPNPEHLNAYEKSKKKARK